MRMRIEMGMRRGRQRRSRREREEWKRNGKGMEKEW